VTRNNAWYGSVANKVIKIALLRSVTPCSLQC